MACGYTIRISLINNEEINRYWVRQTAVFQPPLVQICTDFHVREVSALMSSALSEFSSSLSIYRTNLFFRFMAALTRGRVVRKTILRRAGMASLSCRITPFADMLVIVKSVLLITV